MISSWRAISIYANSSSKWKTDFQWNKIKKKKSSEKEGISENKIPMQLFFENSSLQRNALKLLNYVNAALLYFWHFWLWMS